MYTSYGKTGLMISRLAFGGMRFAEPKNVQKMAEVVLAAHEAGITYFDTAPGYCADMSEDIVGAAVRQMRSSGLPFYLSSKTNKPSAEGVRADLERTLQRLGVDSLDFYHCWYILSLEGWESRKRGGAVDELLKAKQEGLVKHLVFSTHLPGEDIRVILDENIFEGVTLGYNAINFPYREAAVKAAGQAGIGLVVMNPLGGGTIVENPGSFGFIRSSGKESMLQAALGFLWRHPQITAALVGFRSLEDVASAVEAWRSWDPSAPRPDLETVKDQIQVSFDSLCTSCRYCRDCPQEIEVHKFMESYNHMVLKQGESLYDRLKWHHGLDDLSQLDRCTECGSCEAACPQHLPILERFEAIRKAYTQPGA
ncbi:aldo/keto reductase [bacterium]|nr:aldo/keto reductase [bacterium]